MAIDSGVAKTRKGLHADPIFRFCEFPSSFCSPAIEDQMKLFIKIQDSRRAFEGVDDSVLLWCTVHASN